MRDSARAVLIVTAVLLLAFLLMYGAAYMEAKTYNKLTGNNVTTWDAFFVELRVQDAPTAP